MLFMGGSAALLGWGASGTHQADAARLVVREGRFEVHGERGVIAQDERLRGATITLKVSAGEAVVRIDDIVWIETSRRGRIPLYSLSANHNGRFDNLCEPDAQQRRLGIPLESENGRWSFTCTSGAQGKCILMGYEPWETTHAIPMQDLHAACIHMVRADYGGDGNPSTRNGILIDPYDRFGVQQAHEIDPMPFEAAWGREGAICVARPRIPDNITLDDLAARYPRLRGHLGPAVCREAAMAGDARVLILNRSREVP
ncbi:hypothetical protein ILT42_06350 [Microvirga sp. BT291]|nr:hypothetical protein [Microvirga pudoricolor]